MSDYFVVTISLSLDDSTVEEGGTIALSVTITSGIPSFDIFLSFSINFTTASESGMLHMMGQFSTVELVADTSSATNFNHNIPVTVVNAYDYVFYIVVFI